jgi:hypothetical protein
MTNESHYEHGAVMDTLKGAALIATFMVFSPSSPCGYHYGRMCGKPQSWCNIRHSTQPPWAFAVPVSLMVVAVGGLSVDLTSFITPAPARQVRDPHIKNQLSWLGMRKRFSSN